MNAFLKNDVVLSSLFFFFLLLSFSNLLIAGTSEPVLDTDGHPVRVGQKYYMVPPLPGAGGGLTLAVNKGRCPYQIVQILTEHTNGLPVIFSPADNKEKEVKLNTDLNIKFTDFQHTTPCPGSKVWKFDANDQQQGALFVMVGGTVGNPGPETISNWFKIRKEHKSYKLHYCPSPELCGNKCRVVCGDIDVVVYDGRRRLAVNESPLSLVFKKAPTP